MSAFLHCPRHISAVVAAVDLLQYARRTWAKMDARFEHLPFPEELADAFPRVAKDCINGIDDRGTFYALALANAKSVDYRYPAEGGSSVETVRQIYRPESFFWPREASNLLAAARVIASLEYQSCEVPRWEETPAAKWLEKLKNALIAAHPDYVAGPWEIK